VSTDEHPLFRYESIPDCSTPRRAAGLLKRGLFGVGLGDRTSAGPAAHGADRQPRDDRGRQDHPNLVASGTVDSILFGGSGAGSTVVATGSGDNVLIGGPGGNTLKDVDTGYNILIWGAGANTITGNSNDILISGHQLRRRYQHRHRGARCDPGRVVVERWLRGADQQDHERDRGGLEHLRPERDDLRVEWRDQHGE
jgi:hypothetical protein